MECEVRYRSMYHYMEAYIHAVLLAVGETDAGSSELIPYIDDDNIDDNGKHENTN